ncbi:MAG: hypothetical protein JJ895_12680 [Balneolaceae bacterium]|nr:hypothetical protein [Balneolaceae bacterium]
MKVGIVGDATRAVAWEQHLRPHTIVSEVELCPTLHDLDTVDACFILDESEQNLEVLLEGVRRGFHCFLIAKQPTNIPMLEKVHRSAKESGCGIQFSQWPSLAPATRWMMDKQPKPAYLHIDKEIERNTLINIHPAFKSHWMDEVGLCMKWLDSGIHHIEAKEVQLSGTYPIAIHLFLRFDNGSTATINIYSGSGSNRHQRLAANKHEILECNVIDQIVRVGRANDSNRVYFEKQEFDASTAAEKAAILFLKSVQMGKETGYNSYDALQLAIQTERIEARLKKFS